MEHVPVPAGQRLAAQFLPTRHAPHGARHAEAVGEDLAGADDLPQDRSGAEQLDGGEGCALSLLRPLRRDRLGGVLTEPVGPLYLAFAPQKLDQYSELAGVCPALHLVPPIGPGYVSM
jgi:hypothetical protein